MDADHARALAERIHAADREPDGTPLLEHIRRVAAATPAEARPVAWLHEALESGGVSEQDLLRAGLSGEQLRALRLLSMSKDDRTDFSYLAHIAMIAHASGRAGELARIVMSADLSDRRAHPRATLEAWSPPYDRGLRLLPRLDAPGARG